LKIIFLDVEKYSLVELYLRDYTASQPIYMNNPIQYHENLKYHIMSTFSDTPYIYSINGYEPEGQCSSPDKDIRIVFINMSLRSAVGSRRRTLRGFSIRYQAAESVKRTIYILAFRTITTQRPRNSKYTRAVTRQQSQTNASPQQRIDAQQ
jgi:hypothetical protein